MSPAPRTGWVCAAYGRHFEVEETASRQRWSCVRRGKRQDVACGDRVEFSVSAPGQGVIESIGARESLLSRADQKRHKLFAANLTQVVIVTAPQPSPSEPLLGRALVAAAVQGIAPLILLNKIDLLSTLPEWGKRLDYYRELGYPVLALCAQGDVSALQAALAHQRSVLVGQSGMGKTTLLNRLVPEARQETAAISLALDSGRHTTTATRAWHLGEGPGILVDSPGLQSFGLANVAPADLVAGFPEFRGLLDGCRFQDCQHLEEPGCALKAWVAGHPARQRRLELLRQLEREARQTAHDR